MRKIAQKITLLLLLLALGPATVTAQQIGATHGTITVYNESGFDVTIYISSSERGRLEAGYSKSYKVPVGAYRVEARTEAKFDKDGYKDLVLSSTYPDDSWYIHNGDLQ